MGLKDFASDHKDFMGWALVKTSSDYRNALTDTGNDANTSVNLAEGGEGRMPEQDIVTLAQTGIEKIVNGTVQAIRLFGNQGICQADLSRYTGMDQFVLPYGRQGSYFGANVGSHLLDNGIIERLPMISRGRIPLRLIQDGYLYQYRPPAPVAGTRSKWEAMFARLLEENHIEARYNYKPRECRYIYDVMIDDRIIVEINPWQHRERVLRFHPTQEAFERQLERDVLKKDWALERGYDYKVIPIEKEKIEKIGMVRIKYQQAIAWIKELQGH
jgi:hypothetical protein